METRYGMARPLIPKKSIFTTRKEHPLRQPHLRRRFQDGEVKQPMRHSVSDTQLEIFKQTRRNKLKRTRAEEDISSGTTISNSMYEPRKKRRKGDAGVCVPSRYDTNVTLNTIYKNPKFSESRESVPNRISPPVISWSFDSYLYSQAVREALAGTYREHSITSARSRASGKTTSENNMRVAMVTKNDGTRAQIVLRKAVLMHVREFPAQLPEDAKEEPSLMDVEDDQSSVGEDLCCRCKKRKFMNHVSSPELMRMKIPSNERFKRPRLEKTKGQASPASTTTSLCSVQHPVTGEAFAQFPSTSETAAAPVLHNTDGQQTEDSANTTNSISSITKPELEDQPTLALKPFGVLEPPAMNDIPMDKSKSDVFPCTVLVVVCFLLSTLLNVI